MSRVSDKSTIFFFPFYFIQRLETEGWKRKDIIIARYSNELIKVLILTTIKCSNSYIIFVLFDQHFFFDVQPCCPNSVFHSSLVQTRRVMKIFGHWSNIDFDISVSKINVERKKFSPEERNLLNILDSNILFKFCLKKLNLCLLRTNYSI